MTSAATCLQRHDQSDISVTFLQRRINVMYLMGYSFIITNSGSKVSSIGCTSYTTKVVAVMVPKP